MRSALIFFSVYNTVLLTEGTVLYSIRSLELIHVAQLKLQTR
jgi:hypothetical protein